MSSEAILYLEIAGTDHRAYFGGKEGSALATNSEKKSSTRNSQTQAKELVKVSNASTD